MNSLFLIDCITSPKTTSFFVEDNFSLGIFYIATSRYQPAASRRRTGFLLVTRLFLPLEVSRIIGVPGGSDMAVSTSSEPCSEQGIQTEIYEAWQMAMAYIWTFGGCV